ncbi:MAG: hypothetical protein U0Q15_15510 [Kineosporiaceae bacterium]
MGLHPSVRRGRPLRAARANRRAGVPGIGTPAVPSTDALVPVPAAAAPALTTSDVLVPTGPAATPQRPDHADASAEGRAPERVQLAMDAVEALDTLRACPDVSATVSALRALAADATGCEQARVWLLDPTGAWLGEAPGAAGTAEAGPPRLPLGTGPVGRCAAQARPVHARTTATRDGDHRPADADPVTLVHVCLPLPAPGRVVGVLELGWRAGAAAPGQDWQPPGVLAVVAAAAGTQLDLLRLREHGAWALDRDPETGLLHRSRLHRDVSQECARTVRYGQAFSVVVVRVTGGDGWPGQDSPFAAAADLVHAHVRGADAVYRFDDDAVAVLAPATGPEGAAALAARLAEVVQRRFTPAPDAPAPVAPPAVTVVTAGVPADGDTADAVLLDLRLRLAAARPWS